MLLARLEQALERLLVLEEEVGMERWHAIAKIRQLSSDLAGAE